MGLRAEKETKIMATILDTSSRHKREGNKMKFAT